MSFNIVWGKGSVIMSFEGDIDTDEIIYANNKLCGDSKFDELDYQICDFSDIKSIAVFDKHAEIIASMDDNSTVWNTKMKVAIVETIKEHKEEIYKYIELMKDTPWQIKHFENMKDALEWCKT
jgi:hypothetical protein